MDEKTVSKPTHEAVACKPQVASDKKKITYTCPKCDFKQTEDFCGRPQPRYCRGDGRLYPTPIPEGDPRNARPLEATDGEVKHPCKRCGRAKEDDNSLHCNECKKIISKPGF